MLLNPAKCQGYSFYHFWVIKGKPTGGKITQSFLYENHCQCYKKLASRSCSVLFTLAYFFLIWTLLFCWKIKSCYDHCFPQQIRPETTVQWYILRYYSSVRTVFNMINKRHTLSTVCTILNKFFNHYSFT